MTVEAEVTLPDGRKATVKGPTKEAVIARIDALRSATPDVPRETLTPTPSNMNPVVAEVVSALNRGITNIPDFPIDAANAFIDLVVRANPMMSGDDIPRLSTTREMIQENIEPSFGRENFMEPGQDLLLGTTRDLIQALETIPEAALGLGLGATQATKAATARTARELSDQAVTAGRLRVGDRRAVTQAIDDAGRVIDDPVAKGAIDAGFQDVQVANVKVLASNSSERMKRMVDTTEEILMRGQGGTSTRAIRASDEVGQVVADRMKVIVDANRQAGREVGDAAKKLPKNLDFTPARDRFLQVLDDLDVNITDEGVDLVDSQIELDSGAKEILDFALRRLEGVGRNGEKAHKLKRALQKQLYQARRTGKPIIDDAERAIEALRAGLNDVLRESSDAYRVANAKFSETRRALSEFGDIAGRRFDLEKPDPRTIANLSRRAFGNAQSSRPVLDALESMDEIAAKYGADVSEDIYRLGDFADALEATLKTTPKKSLKGLGERAAELGADTLLEGSGRAITNQVSRGVRDSAGVADPEKALAAIRDVITSGAPR